MQYMVGELVEESSKSTYFTYLRMMLYTWQAVCIDESETVITLLLCM